MFRDLTHVHALSQIDALSRSALVLTETVGRLIAAAVINGDSKSPVTE